MRLVVASAVLVFGLNCPAFAVNYRDLAAQGWLGSVLFRELTLAPFCASRSSPKFWHIGRFVYASLLSIHSIKELFGTFLISQISIYT